MFSKSAERRIDDLVWRGKRIQAVRNTAWEGKLKGLGMVSLEWKGCAGACKAGEREASVLRVTERREAFNSREAQVGGKAFTSGWCSTEQVTRRMLQPGLVINRSSDTTQEEVILPRVIGVD